MRVALRNLRPGTRFVLEGLEADCRLVSCTESAAVVEVSASGRLVEFRDRDGHEHRFIRGAVRRERWAPGTVVRPCGAVREYLRT